jgi:hypothetical protein
MKVGAEAKKSATLIVAELATQAAINYRYRDSLSSEVKGKTKDNNDLRDKFIKVNKVSCF